MRNIHRCGAVTLLICMSLNACAYTTAYELPQSGPEATAPLPTRRLHVTLTSGESLVIARPVLEGDSLVGWQSGTRHRMAVHRSHVQSMRSEHQSDEDTVTAVVLIGGLVLWAVATMIGNIPS